MVIELFYSYTSYLPNNFHLSFLLGSYVNDQVEVLIVVPLLEILMSTPPGKQHQQGIRVGVVDYIGQTR